MNYQERKKQNEWGMHVADIPRRMRELEKYNRLKKLIAEREEENRAKEAEEHRAVFKVAVADRGGSSGVTYKRRNVRR